MTRVHLLIAGGIIASLMAVGCACGGRDDEPEPSPTTTVMVPSAPPTTNPPNRRIGVRCADGTSSTSRGRGTCSHHGGVATS